MEAIKVDVVHLHDARVSLHSVFVLCVRHGLVCLLMFMVGLVHAGDRLQLNGALNIERGSLFYILNNIIMFNIKSIYMQA